jgi:hypothetical protein
MLRTRSGTEPVSDPPAASGITLAPEMGELIAAAREEMDRLIQMGDLQNDPIRHPIRALSVHLGALYKLTLDSSQTLARQIEEAHPVTDDDLIRRAVAQGVSDWGSHAVRRMGWMNIVIGAGMLTAALLVGAGSGYWLHGAVPVLVGVHAGAERCEDRADGSRLCWIPVFERLPPAKGGG